MSYDLYANPVDGKEPSCYKRKCSVCVYKNTCENNRDDRKECTTTNTYYVDSSNALNDYSEE